MLTTLRALLFVGLCAACGGGQPARIDAGPGGAGRRAGGSGSAPEADGGGLPVDSGTPVRDAGGICTFDPNASPTQECPADLPKSCDGPAPSYQASVTSVVATHCQPCHRVGGLAPDKPFDTYAKLYKARITVLSRVSNCVMPPACAPQPSSAERHDLLQWLVCGAPNN